MKTAQKFWNMAMPEQGADDSPANLLLYGEIASESWYGDEITPKAFADDLNALGGRDLEVHINSPGGDVFAGQAIYTQLKNYAGNVHVVIDGMCASSATIIAMAGDRVSMPSNAIFMIHNPSVGVMGYLDEPQIDKLKDSLKAVKQTIVNVYKTKGSCLSDQQIKNLMDKESWMTADVAMQNGFIDEIIDPMDVSNAVFVNCVAFAKEKYANYGKETKPMNETEKKSFLDELKQAFSNKQDNTQAINDAVLAERQRIMDLLAMKDGSDVVSDMVDVAIAKGKTADDIAPLVDAVQIALAPAEPVAAVEPEPEPEPEPAPAEPEPEVVDKGVQMMTAVIQDQMQSGAANITIAPADNTASKQAEQSATKNFNDVVKAMMALQQK